MDNKNISEKILLIIAILVGLTNENGADSSGECLITNQKYPDEYLFKSDDIYGNRFFGTFVYLHPIINKNDQNKLKWQLISTPNDENKFYLKNHSSFLCASELEINFNKVRRQVYASRQISHNNCEWRIEKSTDDDINNCDDENAKIPFLIWNTKFNNQLYAGSYFFKVDKYKRNIFLKNDETKLYKSDDYKWFIDCS
jgi:hypothetical protein